MPFLRKLGWWFQRRTKEDELRDELEFHLSEETEDRRATGLTEDQATRAARRDLGNIALVREDARAAWTWTLLEQLAQDVRYALRTMRRNPLFAALAALSLALGIGANTAIYSFMDAILLRSLPVADPASLVVVKWRSRPFVASRSEFVLRSVDGRTDPDLNGVTGGIFPYPAFERLREASDGVFSSLFSYDTARTLNVMIDSQTELANGEYVSGDFFGGLGVPPAAGRLIAPDDDRAGADPVAVVSQGYAQRRFGSADAAVGRAILINNVPFTVVGVVPGRFSGVDPAVSPSVYLPLRANLVLNDKSPGDYLNPNYYWLDMMARLRPGVSLAQAQAALAVPFARWVEGTANEVERANLPVLRLEAGGAGLNTLRREYTKPLYVLLTMVGLILAIACANTANLLLARAAARRREMAVRLSIGAGRSRLVRQLLTESVVLALTGGALGVLIAVAGIGVLTGLLANGQESFTLHADLNWRVLLVTLGLSVLSGIVFGLAPAVQSASPALLPALKDTSAGGPRRRLLTSLPRITLTQGLVVSQIAISLLLLVATGLFGRTLANLQSVPLGFNRDNLLLFDLNAPQAGVPPAQAAAFYEDLRGRFGNVPGVTGATLSRSSIIRAGHAHSITVNGQGTQGSRMLLIGPSFFSTMQIPILRGRGIEDGDRLGTTPVAVVSDLFAKTFFGDRDPIGQHLVIGRNRVDVEVVGVAATVRYGGLKRTVPPVVYVPYPQATYQPLQGMTFALRTSGDPLAMAGLVRRLVHEADARVPVAGVRTQAADIDQTINQEIVFARLCTAFALLALIIASVGLYGTMAYTVARRTREIGIRVALGARRGAVIWMVLREVCVLAAAGLAIGVPIALGTSRFVEAFLFGTRPNDPRAIAIAVVILVSAALAAGFAPARRASRIDPMVALRHE
jgi:macrolide transport system ATP-binding/permease protein